MDDDRDTAPRPGPDPAGGTESREPAQAGPFSPDLVRAARFQPMLSREEETDLARRSREGDAAAVSRLIASHLRMVVRIARGYRSYGLPMSDLVQEGVIGLMQAVRRFNPDREVRFATYAMWWVRASIQDHVVRSWSLVRVGTTAAQKALFLNLRRKMAGLIDGADAWNEEVLAPLARRFGVPAREVMAVAFRAAGRDQSLNGTASGAGEEEWIEQIADPGPSPEDRAAEASERSFWNALLVRSIEMLPPREQVIIRERFLADVVKTREAIGHQLGISKERVRQLEAHALERLRELLQPARSGV